LENISAFQGLAFYLEESRGANFALPFLHLRII
jgi:hypothetical protein